MAHTLPTPTSAGSSNTFECVMTAKLENLEMIQALILNHALIPGHLKKGLCLAAEEIFVNICSYAYEDICGTVDFSLEISDRIILTFCDSGKEFNPLEQKTDIDDYDIDQQVGGLGIFLTFEIADQVAYEYKDHKNILTLTKYL